MIETIVLFGAGASTGCGPVYPHQPPLGTRLYKVLSSVFPQSWGALDNGLARIFTNDFEEGMEQLWKLHSDKSPLLIQQMAIYLSRFAPARPGENSYAKVVRRLVERGMNDTLLCTLNYDLLLDGELTAAGCGVNYFFGSGPGAPLLKLHGSCNWFVQGFEGMNRFVQISSDIQFEGQITSVNTAEQVYERLTADTPLHSVIRLYMANKPAPICPSFFEHLDKQWSEVVQGAKQIAIVGVRPNNQDIHLWSPLASTSANLFCIGDNAAYSEWHQASGYRGELEVIAAKFEDGVDDLLHRLFN